MGMIKKVEICIRASQNRLLKVDDKLDEEFGLWKSDKATHVMSKFDWRIIIDQEPTYEDIVQRKR